jgi:hypothetical protein
MTSEGVLLLVSLKCFIQLFRENQQAPVGKAVNIFSSVSAEFESERVPGFFSLTTFTISQTKEAKLKKILRALTWS